MIFILLGGLFSIEVYLYSIFSCIHSLNSLNPHLIKDYNALDRPFDMFFDLQSFFRFTILLIADRIHSFFEDLQ